MRSDWIARNHNIRLHECLGLPPSPTGLYRLGAEQAAALSRLLRMVRRVSIAPLRGSDHEVIAEENFVPKRRDIVKMSDDEIWKFIDGQKTVQVATINKDGSPHVMPLWFAIEDRRIVLETFTKSQKIVNLERDDRISILFEDGESYNDLKGVSIKGRAELIREHDEVHRLHMAVLVRNQPEVPVELLERATASMVSKKTAIVIEPSRFITWDHSKLGGVY